MSEIKMAEVFATLGTDRNSYASDSALFLRMPRFRLYNPLNGSQGTTRGAMRAAAKQRKAQRSRTMLEMQTLLLKLPMEQRREWFRAGKLNVWIIRVSPRKFDSWDGLPASLKPVFDGVADAFECDDRDPRFTWNSPSQAYGGKAVNEVYIVIERKE